MTFLRQLSYIFGQVKIIMLPHDMFFLTWRPPLKFHPMWCLLLNLEHMCQKLFQA